MLSPKPQDAYGAWTELARYSGEKFRFPRGNRPLHWQHGWSSSLQNLDPDLVVGEDGRASSQKADGFLVGRHDQVEFLNGHGFESVRAIGLPFVYALENVGAQADRKAGSLLVMPGDHATEEVTTRNWEGDTGYIAFLRTFAGDFSEIRVMLHGADIRLGRDLRWVDAGFEVSRGADYFDPTSLNRLAMALMGADSVTTNDLGSHVPYAAAAGCRVSIAGPVPRSAASTFSHQTFYRNRPDLVALVRAVGKSQEEELNALGLFTPPSDGKRHVAWGLGEIGWDHRLEPSEVLRTLHQVGTFPPDSILNLLRRIPFVYVASKRARNFFQRARDRKIESS